MEYICKKGIHTEASEVFDAKGRQIEAREIFDSMVQKVAESVDMHRCILEGLTWVFIP